MNITKEIRIVGLIVWITLVVLCSLISRNTNAVNEGNRIGNEMRSDSRYERVLLGCQTSGAIESKNEWLRQLCDVDLSEIREEILTEG